MLLQICTFVVTALLYWLFMLYVFVVFTNFYVPYLDVWMLPNLVFAE